MAPWLLRLLDCLSLPFGTADVALSLARHGILHQSAIVCLSKSPEIVLPEAEDSA